MASFSTHTVFNQVPPLEDYSLYETDPALRWLRAAAWENDLAAHGAWLGRADAGRRGRGQSPSAQADQL